MAEIGSSPTSGRGENSAFYTGGDEKLSKWVAVSLLFHGAFILTLLIVPFLPSRHAQTYPIYTVDLVGGDKIGGTNFGTTLKPSTKPKEVFKIKAPAPPEKPPEPRKETPKKEVEIPKPIAKKTPAPPEKPPEPRKETKKKAPEVAKPAEKPNPPESNVKTVAKKEPVKASQSETKSDHASLDNVRERLIQSAVERAKNRSERSQKDSEETISAGAGEGEGAAALGPGGRGGGVVKGLEFIIYQNRMLSTIKQNWAWIGQRTDLRVVVRFGIKENGEIAGLKIIERSGDPSYDESVLRAVKKSSPLPAPPESHRKDFADIELTFRPRDLGA